MPLIVRGQDDLNKLYKRFIQIGVGRLFVSTSLSLGETTHYMFTSVTILLRRLPFFLEKTTSGHAVLVTQSSRGHACSAVSFSQCEPSREEIFTITEVEGGYAGFNFMTGTIASPSCFAAHITKHKIVPGSERKFALTCPAGSPAVVTEEEKELSNRQILGAGVFDLDGSLIGTISSLDEQTHDLKFAQQVCHWVDNLEAELKAKDEKISLTKTARKARPGPSGRNKGPDGRKRRRLKDEQINNFEENASSVCHSLTI